jgi:hypothetical protein
MDLNDFYGPEYDDYIRKLEDEYEDLCISNNKYENIREDLINYKFGNYVDTNCFDEFFYSKVIELSVNHSYDEVLDIIYNEYKKRSYIIEDNEKNEVYERVYNMCYSDYYCYYSSDVWKFYTHNINRVTKYMLEKHTESTVEQMFDILYLTDSYIISSSIVNRWYYVDDIPENRLLTDEEIEMNFEKIKVLPVNHTLEDVRNLNE